MRTEYAITLDDQTIIRTFDMNAARAVFDGIVTYARAMGQKVTIPEYISVMDIYGGVTDYGIIEGGKVLTFRQTIVCVPKTTA